MIYAGCCSPKTPQCLAPTAMDTPILNFKFRDLKSYSSTEWLADNKKKYRQVFDKAETTYIFAELSFFNKMFDRDDWDVKITLKCFSSGRSRKEVCAMDIERKVSKLDNVVYVREGWGNEQKANFWKKGNYFWEAYIDGIKVGTRYFYVVDSGQAEYSIGNNPFIELLSVKLYEAPFDDLPKEQRTYYKRFLKDETRYVFSEVSMRNIFKGHDWPCELSFKFCNGVGELKGQVNKFVTVGANDDRIEISASWGNNTGGSWRDDNYTVEIVFMDRFLCSIPFSIGAYWEMGTPGLLLSHNIDGLSLTNIGEESIEKVESFDELIQELDNMVGLGQVKRQVREHAQYVQFLKLRRQKGIPEEENPRLHSVFLGNPGTGKTTVAKMLGQLYRSMGILSKGHVIEADRTMLVGEYIGQTAPKVKEAIDKARGGVLFIDEAYALSRSNDDNKDFGREVIEMLIKEMSDGPGDLVVVAAGYPKEMKGMLDSNPGLKSRFKMTFEFPDYLPQELEEIAAKWLALKNVKCTPEAGALLHIILTEAFRKRDRSFGNARFVVDLVESAKRNMALRVMDAQDPQLLSTEELSTIESLDIEKLNIKIRKPNPNIQVDQKLLYEAQNELERLVGIEQVKAEIKNIIQLVRYYRESNKDVLGKFYLHTVFVGNPGTGKTTVARILAKIYKALGILERGHTVETDRQGLVAGFVGQTAIKTAEKIDEALGGVLFIDEAYSLTDNRMSGGDFGSEVVQTLLKRMEDHRGEFFVFAAGYPENMEQFLKANPGLKSRFDRVLKFDDYSEVELLDIATLMLAEEGLIPDTDAREQLRSTFQKLYSSRDKYFGNARTVRQVVTEAVKNQSLRLASMDPSERSPQLMAILKIEDVQNLAIEKSDEVFNKKAIGFKAGGR